MGWGQILTLKNDTCNFASRVVTIYKLHWYGVGSRLTLKNDPTCISTPPVPNRGRLLLRTPGPVPFGTCICSNVETILS